MAHVISFRSAKFYPSKEERNPINPIAGQEVLSWLRDSLTKAEYHCSLPDPEDWGWYIDVSRADERYLVGASGDVERTGLDVEWTIQVHRNRSFTERLLGRKKLATDDSLSRLIEQIVRSDPAIEDISVDREA